jgi:hypothetical protein
VVVVVSRGVNGDGGGHVRPGAAPATASPPGDVRPALSLRVDGVAPGGTNADDHVFLTGRPSLRDFVAFVRDRAADGATRDPRALADQWRRAHDEVRARERDEAGLADQAPVAPVPPELEPLRQACLGGELFRHAFDVVEADISMVELDRLVVFQKHVNLEFARRVRERLGERPDAAEVFRTCIPFDVEPPPVRWMRLEGETYSFVSESSDLRFLGGQVLQPGRVLDPRVPGRAAAFVGLPIGFGSNYMNAVWSDGRVVLHNGSHRAYALRAMGITHVPCVVQRVTGSEDLLAVAANDLRRAPDYYLRRPRPPMLRDYFDPALHTVVPCFRRHRQVRVRCIVEEHDLPAY